MNDRIYYLHTRTEHGKTDERLRRCAGLAMGMEPEDSRLEVRRTGEGKPFFPLLALHCSVSHSGGIWMCAISDKPVGVDIQRAQRCDAMKIAGRFFHPDEISWLKENTGRFFELWCAKESYVKFTGGGLAMGLDEFSVIENGKMRQEISGASLRQIPFLPEYSLCLCGGDGGETQIIELK